MATNKTCCILVLISMTAFALPVTAQQAHKKVVSPTKASYKVVMLPEFYQYYPIKKGDTTFSFESLDADDKKINIDQQANLNSAEEILIYKSYYQFAHKPGSPISPPYLSFKIFTFERTSKNTWIGTDLFTKVKTGIKEIPGTIVRADTLSVADPTTGAKQAIIHKYYKVDLVEEKDVPGSHHHH